MASYNINHSPVEKHSPALRFDSSVTKSRKVHEEDPIPLTDQKCRFPNKVKLHVKSPTAFTKQLARPDITKTVINAHEKRFEGSYSSFKVKNRLGDMKIQLPRSNYDW